MTFEKIGLTDIELAPFTAFDKGWGLVTAGDAKKYNTMTVSWGGLGTLWNKPVATIYIRPQRFTKQFVDANDRFTVSLFDGDHKRELGVLGTKSGRDGNKVAEVGFTSVELAGQVAFEEAQALCSCAASSTQTRSGPISSSTRPATSAATLSTTTTRSTSPRLSRHIYAGRVEPRDSPQPILAPHLPHRSPRLA